MRVLADLEVPGEVAPHFAVALALVLLRQHADLGVDQCLELRLLRRGEGVGGRQGPFPLALQLGLQRVEGFDVGQLEAHGLGACIAHHQESEAVLEDDEHGAILGLIINIVNPTKLWWLNDSGQLSIILLTSRNTTS